MNLLRTIFRNFPIKIVALLLAVIVWFLAVLERNQAVTMDLPVTLGKIPSGLVVAAVDTGRVKAQLAGRGRDLLLLRLRKPVIRLNLVSENPGRSRVRLTQEQTNLPATVQLVATRPEYLAVDLDQQARRAVKVVIPLRGKPAPGFVATLARTLEPVYLTGPAEEINLIPAVNTESLSLADLNAATERKVRVLPPSLLGTPLGVVSPRFRVEPESVDVRVLVEPEAGRVFGSVALTVFKPAARALVVRPPTAQISVSGAAGAVKALTLQDISATLKITDTIPKGKLRLPCEITLPPGITLVKCEPAFFDVEIR
jgi:hypothetical protein